jgi:hypothetical protein
LSSPSGLPPRQWKSSLRTFYGCHHHLLYPQVSRNHHLDHSTVVIPIWFTPKSVEVITKNILRLSDDFHWLGGKPDGDDNRRNQIIMNPFWFTEILSSLFYRHYFQGRNCLPEDHFMKTLNSRQHGIKNVTIDTRCTTKNMLQKNTGCEPKGHRQHWWWNPEPHLKLGSGWNHETQITLVNKSRTSKKMSKTDSIKQWRGCFYNIVFQVFSNV